MIRPTRTPPQRLPEPHAHARLPDKSHFEADYDAAKGTWTGTLQTGPSETLAAHGVAAEAAALMTLCAKLDVIYRRMLREEKTAAAVE